MRCDVLCNCDWPNCHRACSHPAGHLGLHSWAPDPWPRLIADPTFVAGMARAAEERAERGFRPFVGKRPEPGR